MDGRCLERLVAYVELLHEWNAFASLMSRNDLEENLGAHVADSLSLLPVIRRCCPDPGLLLDIGSGGGFPALPLKMAAPEYDMVLVERTMKKAGFLRKAIGAMGLQGITVFTGTFPDCARSVEPDLITARAVERRGDLHERILDYLPAGSTFLCPAEPHPSSIQPMFHVERVEDEWAAKGLRRGDLFTITRLA